MSTSLLDLPPELIERILVLCDPVDVARASMVCQRLYAVVYGDSGIGSHGVERQVFWMELYLNEPWDDLRRCVDWLGTPRVSSAPTDVDVKEYQEGDIDWRMELQKAIRARSVVTDIKCCKGEEELREVYSTLLGLVKYVPALNAQEDLAKNLVWVPIALNVILDSVEKGIPSTLFEHTSQPLWLSWRLPPIADWKKETKQLHAQLRTLYGLTRSDLTKTRRVESWAWVYDMRKYTHENDYGPVRDGGKHVDWEFVERIHHVMSMHVVWEQVKDWVQEGIFEAGSTDSGGQPAFDYMIYPMCMPYTQPWIGIQEDGEAASGVPMVEANEESGVELPENADWARIGGTWVICFCFCDHRDLIAFNESTDPETGRLDVSLFEEEGFTEAFRRLKVTLHATRILDDPEHPGKPKIGFLGVVEPPSSTMYGLVQLTADNHIKWQFFSGDLGGNAIWSSVGIQVGGIGSSYGVLGSWTTISHDEDDPVGPFWMRKSEM